MIRIDGDWSGRITGTNNAQLYVELKQEADKLFGVVRINDPIYGTAVYPTSGGFFFYLFIKKAMCAVESICDSRRLI